MAFAPAFLVVTLLSLALIALAVRPFAAGNPLVWLAMTLSPAFIAPLVVGQNSLIWLACLLAALAALRAERWLLAGVLIGFLTLKPQLGVMILVALLGGGHWRTILAASATAILVAGLPTLLVGVEYWPLFFERLSQHGDYTVGGIHSTTLMVGSFSLLVSAGIPPETALTLQTGLAVLCAVAVFLVWRPGRADPDTKAAALLTTIFLSAPYLWFYEAGLMALVGLFLFRAGLIGRDGPLRIALPILYWLGPAPQSVFVFLGLETRFPWAALYVPLMLYALFLCLRHIAGLHRPTPEPA
jgi:hypothetical protein